MGMHSPLHIGPPICTFKDSPFDPPMQGDLYLRYWKETYKGTGTFNGYSVYVGGQYVSVGDPVYQDPKLPTPGEWAQDWLNKSGRLTDTSKQGNCELFVRFWNGTGMPAAVDPRVTMLLKAGWVKSTLVSDWWMEPNGYYGATLEAAHSIQVLLDTQRFEYYEGGRDPQGHS